MIATVTPRIKDLGLAQLLGAIGSGRGGGTPEQVEPGLFKCGHWNFDAYLSPEWTRDWDFEGEESRGMPPEYGVCDSIGQFKRKYFDKLSSDPKHEYVVSFVHIQKALEPQQNGWRWCKWGEYVGEKEPKYEYLAHEPEITEVYTFHVYRKPVSTGRDSGESIPVTGGVK